MTFTGFLFVYVLGGLTFIPLVIGLILLHAHLTFPTYDLNDAKSNAERKEPSILERPNDDPLSFKTGTDALAEKFNRKHEADVAAGYFAVCREYVPGGVNGKPPERTTPAGEVVSAESPSVYQSMYRSIFDRKEKPTLEPAKTGGKSTKKPRNVFFVVLRHGHLMLYDDAEQIEVRHVISLEYHDVSIYGGGQEEIPDGDLFLKRNAICLSRKRPAKGDMGVTSLPFYFFSENRSDKEDFYFALLRNQQKMPGSSEVPPEPLQFEVKDIIRLVQDLHSSQEHLQTRWFNAIIGRIFLAMYKTPVVEQFVRRKIIKMISRVKKPTFITKIVLRNIDLGDSGPSFLNPRLRDLTVHGDCTSEADVKYAGNFRIEIAATARIDLGRRFGAREVEIVLAVVVRKVEGHILVKIKPPPSNRFWFTFETMPTVEMTIEPIVSTRQITYTVILRAIESRIREVIAESVVFPFWSDASFMDTRGQQYRGGIWKQQGEPEMKHDEIKDEVPEDEAEAGSEGFDMSSLKQVDERTMSMPTMPAASTNVKLRGNKSVKSTAADVSPSASTTGLDRSSGTQAPRVLRSNSFASPAHPTVTTNSANADSESLSSAKKDAVAAMKEISDRSTPSSPSSTPYGSGSPPNEPDFLNGERKDSTASNVSNDIESVPPSKSAASAHSNISQASIPSNAAAPTFEGEKRTPSRRSTTLSSLTNPEKRQQSLANISAATAAAKSWGLGMINRRNEAKSQNAPRPGTPEQPIGRGRPLPPPGVPLPPPDRSMRSIPSLPKRKPVPPPLLPERKQPGNGSHAAGKRPAPPLPERRKQRAASQAGDERGSEEVLVVEAPAESAPSTPIDESTKDFHATAFAKDEGSDGPNEEEPVPSESPDDIITEAEENPWDTERQEDNDLIDLGDEDTRSPEVSKEREKKEEHLSKEGSREFDAVQVKDGMLEHVETETTEPPAQYKVEE